MHSELLSGIDCPETSDSRRTILGMHLLHRPALVWTVRREFLAAQLSPAQARLRTTKRAT